MNVCLKLLRLLSGKEKFPSNFVSLHQLFCRHGTMTDNDSGNKVMEDPERVVLGVEKSMDNNIDKICGKEIELTNITKESSINSSKTTDGLKQCDERNKTRHRKTKNNCEQLIYKPSWSTGANIGDLICFGATILIVLLLISILIFYVFKDNETDIDT